MMERETGEHLPTSEKPHIILQDSHQTNETPINKSSIVLLEHGDQRYTDGELAHSTKSLVNKEVEEKGPEDCVEETSYKPVSTSRSRRGRPRKKRQQKKKVKSISSKVLPVQPGLGDPSVEEHGSKALPLPCSKDGVTSKSSEVLQTELHPIQGSSNTFVKSKKNMEVCSLPVSVECKAKGPASKNQKITESKKASVEVKERTPIISEIETSNTSVSKSENVVTLPHKECSTTASLQDAILLVEAMNQSAVENTVPQSQNSAQSQTRGSAIKRTINNVGQMAQKISLQPLKTLTTKALDASTSRGATTFADSIIPKIIIVQKRNQTVACDGVPPVTVLSEKALTQTPTTSQFPTQPLIVQPNRKTRIILVPRTDCGSASHKTTGVCPLKLSSCTMTENQNNNLPKNSAYVDLPLLPPSTSQAPKKTIKVSYKQIFPDVHSLTKAVSACQQLEFSPQLKKVVESQTAPDKPNSLENLESVVQSESLEIPESVVQRETLGLPESLEMSESVINPESSEMSESVINPESSEMSESVINPESSEMSESIIQPESSEVSESIIQPESSEVSESIIQPESSEVSESIIQPESLEMPESDVQSETSNMPDPLEIPESVAQSESLVVPKSLEKPQQLEKQELVDQPEFSENSKTVVLKEKQDTEEITTLPEALSMKISTTSQEVKLALIDNMTMVENMDTTDSSDSSDQTTSPSKVANISKEACSSSDKSTELPGSVSSILSVPTKQNVSPVVRLTRLPFFVSTKETVLISRLSSNEYMIDRKDKVGQGIEQKNSGISTSTSSQKAHKKGSVKLSVACNRIDSSQKLAMKRKQTSKKRQDGQLQPTSYYIQGGS
ncbi:110 kDa antigen [Oryzias melastigma]|uniref:110 kDa antigen n=1 Tax=Oryzias melastigma TaxID=30732 RepID=A0A834FBY5_ORYME|nr:110 kDa antigen [Oryzias melastigma]